MSRGILSTIYVKLEKDVHTKNLHECLSNRYANNEFVTVLDFGKLPSTKDVYGTNHCYIGICKARTPDRAVVVSAIDNLTKGSSGQAIQNMNLMYGFNEGEGLRAVALFP